MSRIIPKLLHASRLFNVVAAAASFCLLCTGCSSCFGESDNSDCFSPEDPCPNDMITDESGCCWDQCSGDFTGNLMPCWYADTSINVGDLVLAGSRSQYLAYIKTLDEFGMRELGQVWIYDLENNTHTQITGGERMCYKLKADGDRLAWAEMVEYGTGTGRMPISDVHVKDIVSGQEWHIPNPNRVEPTHISISGNVVVLAEENEIQCPSLGNEYNSEIWMYNLGNSEKTLIAESEFGKYEVTSCRVRGNSVVFWKLPGYCAEERLPCQLWVMNIETDEKRLVADLGTVNPPVGGDTTYLFHFDGDWAVFSMLSRIGAYNVSSGSFTEVTSCYKGDCHLFADEGIVIFDRYGEDGLDQSQLHAFELSTGKKQRITNLRPFFDGAMPWSMKGKRAFWVEGRGKRIVDDCGNERIPTGKTPLWFWKDIEF